MAVQKLDGNTTVLVDADGAGGHRNVVELISAGAVVGGGNPLPTTPGLSTGGTPTAGTLAATTVAAQLAASQACKGVILQNLITNTVDVLVGDSGSQPFRLTPGQAIFLAVSNANLVWVKTVSSTASVPWISIV